MSMEINRLTGSGGFSHGVESKLENSKKNVEKKAGSENKSASISDPKDVRISTINDDTLDKIPRDVQKYFSKGNKVTPLFDSRQTPSNEEDDIFKEIEKTIRSAKKSIQLEMYGLGNQNMTDLLIDEARRGVKVQVLVDPVNEEWEAEKKEAVEQLKKNGVDVKVYPTSGRQINHIKMLIVDGNQAVIGGMNWGSHSPMNHDFDVKVEGPAVDNMEWIFREDWIKSGGEPSDLPWIEDTPPHPEGDALVNVVTSGKEPREQTIAKTIPRAIRNAKKSVHAELFVLTEGETLKELKAAHARGVDVKVLLHPLRINGYGVNERAARELKRAGVPVKWYVCNKETKEKLHAKMATFDDDQVIVGSANWTKSGYYLNREIATEILSKEVNSKFEKIFQKDWKTKSSDEPIYFEELKG